MKVQRVLPSSQILSGGTSSWSPGCFRKILHKYLNSSAVLTEELLIPAMTEVASSSGSAWNHGHLFGFSDGNCVISKPHQMTEGLRGPAVSSKRESQQPLKNI